MTKVYIVRHAEAEGNLYRRVHGQYDSVITDTGMEQIIKLSERFRDIKINAVYSSDLIRTQTTAQAIALPKGLEIATTPDLREVNMGIWEDMTWGEVAIGWPQMLRFFTADPDKWVVKDSEHSQVVVKRMKRALTDLAAKHDGGTIALFTHGTSLRILFAHILGIPSDKIMDVGMSDNTAVSLLEVSGENINLRYKNDNSHLPEGLSIFSKQSWHKKNSGDDGNNLRYEPMDLAKNKGRYMEYRKDGWKAVHGIMTGYTDEYYALAKKHQKAHSRAVSEVFAGNESIGLVELDTLSGIKEGFGNLAFCYLRPSYRDKGFGVQLFGEAVSVLRPLGIDKIRLHVSEDNPRGIKFYIKNGFENVGQTRGALCNLHIMEKDIKQQIRPLDLSGIN